MVVLPISTAGIPHLDQVLLSNMSKGGLVPVVEWMDGWMDVAECESCNAKQWRVAERILTFSGEEVGHDWFLVYEMRLQEAKRSISLDT